MVRKWIDCSKVLGGSGYTLRMSDEEDEVLRRAVLHAVDAHGHAETAELRERMRGLMRDEAPPAG